MGLSHSKEFETANYTCKKGSSQALEVGTVGAAEPVCASQLELREQILRQGYMHVEECDQRLYGE